MGAGGPAANKRIGGAASNAQLKPGIAVPSGGLTAGEGPGFNGFLKVSVAASVPFVLTLSTPIVIAGTQCLVLLGLLANRTIAVGFDFEEL